MGNLDIVEPNGCPLASRRAHGTLPSASRRQSRGGFGPKVEQRVDRA
jgi:hypothetical protein